MLLSATVSMYLLGSISAGLWICVYVLVIVFLHVCICVFPFLRLSVRLSVRLPAHQVDRIGCEICVKYA